MSNDNKVKPCFRYAGGKTQLLKHILPLIPDHKRYVEAFAGGLAVLLAKSPCRIKAINDISPDLATFYRVLRFHKNALIKELATLPNSREIFDETVKVSSSSLWMTPKPAERYLRSSRKSKFLSATAVAL